jgi:hypothetical protein
LTAVVVDSDAEERCLWVAFTKQGPQTQAVGLLCNHMAEQEQNNAGFDWCDSSKRELHKQTNGTISTCAVARLARDDQPKCLQLGDIPDDSPSTVHVLF